MVRRVRPGRPDAPRRARRWAGPPPLLVLATLVGLLVVPFVDEGPRAAPVAVTAAHVAAPQREPDPRVSRPLPPAASPTVVSPPSRAGQVSTGVRPARREPVEVGVASMNMWRDLPSAKAAADARRLTRDPRVDVVGWQEAERFGPVLRGLRGWATKTFSGAQGTSELAVSWRRTEFRYVSAWQQRVIPGVSARQGRYPFGSRWIAVVVLEERSTGRRFAVLDAHLPPAIENLARPGAWRSTPNADQARHQLRRVAAAWRVVRARWVVGTGDFNFDAAADERRRAAGTPLRTVGRPALSTYQALGLRGLRPTYPSNGRHIDYVWVDRAAHRDGRLRVARQWVPGGFNSDHNPLITRLLLS